MDIAGLDRAWGDLWQGSPPVARLLRGRFPERHVRFHTLPGGTRYASSPAEGAEILRRHHEILGELVGPERSNERLVAVTCSWSATSEVTPRDIGVAAIMPEATHWRSDDRATEPGFHSWQHHFASEVRLGSPALDELLECVANDGTDEVTLTDSSCAWVYHPYDGGIDLFTRSTGVRDRLMIAYAEWLPGAV
ncbi:hypothetical protein AB0M43_27650 [Longispora sp. NPDC051575]|uniref:DUF3885 domain-containing protein n=1 Tax=Longispora sp. NPDC051575 TaxID=3154943 RepID=UPI003446D9BC